MFVRSPKSKYGIAFDLAAAMLPTAAWATFLFGLRAAVLMAVCGMACLLLDVPVQKFIFRRPWKQSVSVFAFLTGVLAMFWMPVTVPMWFPLVMAAIVTLARSTFVYFGHRVFNPSVLSACVMGLFFPQYTERFTKPFAYFHALQWEIDPLLVDAYRVTTPLDILQGGTLYSDGVYAQLYGFASGAMGAVAVACLIMGGVWLYLRRLLSVRATAGFLCTLLFLAMAFSPDSVEMWPYSYMYLLSGGLVYASVFAVNDLSTVPRTENGKLMFGILAGGLTFAFRSFLGGEGTLYAILVCNLLTPVMEQITQEKPYFSAPRKPKEIEPQPEKATE